MKYCLTYLYAVCRALLQKDSRVYIITKNEEDVKSTIYFKNGSYIKTIALSNPENVYRGKRANIIDWYDCNAPSKEEIDEILNNLKDSF